MSELRIIWLLKSDDLLSIMFLFCVLFWLRKYWISCNSELQDTHTIWHVQMNNLMIFQILIDLIIPMFKKHQVWKMITFQLYQVIDRIQCPIGGLK